MKLRVRLLGTGPSPGVPNIGGADEAGDWGACDPEEPRNRRTRTAALIEAADGTRLLIDPGPDIRAQLLAARVARLDAVLITHAHADHVMGLDELRAVNRATGRALPVHAMPETLADLTQRFGYAFLEPTRGFYRPALIPLAAGRSHLPCVQEIFSSLCVSPWVSRWVSRLLYRCLNLLFHARPPHPPFGA